MADEVTSAEKTPEDIERDMLHTRESLTEKVAALETQVAGTVQNAAETINGTVEAVKSLVTQAPSAVSDTVKQAAAAVSETVKDTFDITGHVRRHPWTSVGASAMLGCIVGWLVSRGGAPASSAAYAAAPEPRRADTGPPGVFDEYLGMIGDKVKDLARTALETVSTALKESIQTRVPNLVDSAAARLTDTDEPGAGVPRPATYTPPRAYA